MNLFCWTILIAYTAENLSDIFKHKYSMYVLIKSLPRLPFMASKSVFSFQVNDFCSCKCTYGSLLHTQSLANASYCLSVPCILLKTIELNLLYDWFLYCESIPLFSHLSVAILVSTCLKSHGQHEQWWVLSFVPKSPDLLPIFISI